MDNGTTFFGRLFGGKPPTTVPQPSKTSTADMVIPTPLSPVFENAFSSRSTTKTPNAQRVRYTNADDSAQPWGFQQMPVHKVTLQGNAFSFTKPSGAGMDGAGRPMMEMPSLDTIQPYSLPQRNASLSGQGGPAMPSYPANTSQDTFHRPRGAPSGITVAVPSRSDTSPSHTVYSSSSHCPSPTVGSDNDLRLNYLARTRSNTVLNGASPTQRLDMDHSGTGRVALGESHRSNSNADIKLGRKNTLPLNIVTRRDDMPGEHSASTVRKPEPPPKPSAHRLPMSTDTISLTPSDCHQISRSVLMQRSMNGWSPDSDTEQFPVAKDHPHVNHTPLVDGPGPPGTGAVRNPSQKDIGSQCGNVGNSSVMSTETRRMPTSKPVHQLDESEEDDEESEDEKDVE
ncbi:hypothetical protein IWQ62_006659, partial [Dispira parvispora]